MNADPVRCVAEFLSLGTGTDLARSALTGQVRPIRTSVAGAAEACSTFRSPQDQVEFLRRELDLPEHRAPALRALIDDLLRDGIFASARDLVSALGQRASRREVEPLRTVGVVTRDRPDALHRCLRSYATHAQAHERWVRFVVSDQSRHPDVQRANAAVVEQVRAESGFEVMYVGNGELQALAARLVERERLPVDVVRFALGDPLGLGCPIGANRNALLLHCVGHRVLCSDDDMVCRPLGAAPRARLTLREGAADVDHAFHQDRDGVLAATDAVDVDLFGVHERLLGRSVADAVADFEDVEVADASLATLRAALQDALRVRVTQSGHAGDSGMGSPSWILAQRGRGTLDEWLSTEASYRQALGAREILRHGDGWTISDAPDLMGGTMGLDLDGPVPPFFPTLRNEDGLFGHHLRLLVPSARIGFCPVAPLHAPPPRAQDPDAWLRGAGRLSCVDLVLLGLATAPRMEGTSRFATLGRWFEELGGLRPRAFEDWLRQGHWRRCTLEVEALRERLEVHGDTPAWWAADVRRYLQTVGERATARGAHLPTELARGRTDDEALALARQVLRSWGRLLVVWTDVWAAAGRAWTP